MAKKRRNKKSGGSNKPRIKPVCKFYLEDRCIKGDQCTFRHSLDGKGPAAARTQAEPTLPTALSASFHLLTPSQQTLATKLCGAGQSHLFESWDDDPSNNGRKQSFMSTLESIDASYPSNGLLGYLDNARTLLDKSRRGENPLEGWLPSVPNGERFELGTNEFCRTEELGLKEVGRCGFVLVAGGLGERLGYGDIKIGLPTELATETSYIQFYIETILAFQSRYAKPGMLLPLCIMTSGDTNDKTLQLLKKNNYFGMKPEQITVVQQGMGVPALVDNQARIALDPHDIYTIQLKPHGHGDIHSLLYSHHVAKSWLDNGIKWMVFFQDTNGLAFHTLALSCGVSEKLGLVMNSITCPRKAKQAIGAITKLTKGNEQRTMNVEYNQLDPLLRASGSEGDVNDENGFSPYPGNINQLLFRLKDYVATLERTKGVMPEFVNPKYADAEKTVFKKPTRLECMMQDFPTVLTGAQAEKVGFTSLASEMCFSPVKNATSDGVNLQINGTHPGVAATGEADQSGAARRLLRSIGCKVMEGNRVKFSGIEVISGPDVVLKPSFAVCSTECKKKFPNPSAIKISRRSSLVVEGEGLIIESLDLDGALMIESEPGASGVIRNLSIRNKGWVKVPVADNKKSVSEVIKMRGYYLDKLETHRIVLKKDGSITEDTCVLKNAHAKKKSVRTKPSQKTTPAPVVDLKMETEVDLSKPAPSEKESDTLCGGACVIL